MPKRTNARKTSKPKNKTSEHPVRGANAPDTKGPELFPEGWGEREFREADSANNRTSQFTERGPQLSGRRRRLSLADMRRLAKKGPAFIADPNRKIQRRARAFSPP
jgi:hypothetical protein